MIMLWFCPLKCFVLFLPVSNNNMTLSWQYHQEWLHCAATAFRKDNNKLFPIATQGPHSFSIPLQKRGLNLPLKVLAGSLWGFPRDSERSVLFNSISDMFPPWRGTLNPLKMFRGKCVRSQSCSSCFLSCSVSQVHCPGLGYHLTHPTVTESFTVCVCVSLSNSFFSSLYS